MYSIQEEDIQYKNNIFITDLPDEFLKKFSCTYITFLRYLYIIFKDKKSKRCHKTLEIKVFLTIFA